MTSIGSLFPVNACKDGSLRITGIHYEGKKRNEPLSEIAVSISKSKTEVMRKESRAASLLDAEERIAEQLLANGTWDRNLDIFIHAPLQLLCHMCIIRFNVKCKPEV